MPIHWGCFKRIHFVNKIDCVKKKNLKEMHSEHLIILGNGEAEQTIMNNE